MRVRALCAVLHSFNHWFFHSVLVLLWCCRWTLHTWKDACSFNMCGTPVCFILLFFLLCIFPGWTDCWCCCYLLLFLFSVLRFYQLLLEKLSEYHHAPEAIAKKKRRSRSWNGNHVWECCLNWTLRAWIWHTSGPFISRNIICIHKSQENERNSSNARRNGILWFFGGKS